MRVLAKLGTLWMFTLTALLTGCVMQEPLRQSEDSIELFVQLEDIVIQGPTRGSTRSFQIFSFQFGERNSFLEAEKQALEANHSTVLLSRVRLRTFEGFLIPSLWLNVLGIPAKDIPIIGWEVYHVGGIGVQLPAGGAGS